MFSSVLWETVGDTASGLNLVIADCTIVRVSYRYWEYYSE